MKAPTFFVSFMLNQVFALCDEAIVYVMLIMDLNLVRKCCVEDLATGDAAVVCTGIWVDGRVVDLEFCRKVNADWSAEEEVETTNTCEVPCSPNVFGSMVLSLKCRTVNRAPRTLVRAVWTSIGPLTTQRDGLLARL